MLKILKKMLQLRDISGIDNALKMINQLNKIENDHSNRKNNN